MINTASLDTSLIIRILTRDNRKDMLRAVRLFNENINYKIADLVITETVYVLESVYNKSRREIVDLLNFFLTRYDEKIYYNHDLTSAVFPVYLAHPKLSFNDCCLAVMAELDSAEPLFTLDKKLAKQLPQAKLAG